MEIHFSPIGTIHSPFHDLGDMPIQPSSECSAPGTVEVLPEFTQGLIDLEGFSHIILLYFLHRSNQYTLSVTPYLDEKPHGVFATRAPRRPNPIGLSVVKLNRVEGNLLYVDNLDILDGTPLLDIKPYVPEFDSPPDFRLGWLESKRGNSKQARSDQRFTTQG
ncbi:MAG: tRNA (N6-threonylcarbamoyladenosine(37)-N6)-methyltransferase TrmO [Acidobacteriaceae bacterium]